MREVQPEVYLVSFPEVDLGGMSAYLDAVGGHEWMEKKWDTIFESTNGAEMLVEFGGRLCYRSWEPGLNPNVTRVREDSKEYLGNILSSKHGSVLEHANFSFALHNISRVLTHELVRHRAGVAVSQESMRFVRLTDIPFWFPDWAKDDPILMERLEAILMHMEDLQVWMTDHFNLDDPEVPFSEKKHKTSFMRRFAPDGVATSMLITINVRALRHIIHARTSIHAEEEIRVVCDKIAEKVLEAVPNLMQDFNPNEDREWIPDFVKV